MEVLRRSEELNGGTTVSLGIILFDQIGLTAGGLDESARTGLTETAFAPGTWDDKTTDFGSVTFN
jgi:hypothetical protein